MSTTIDRLEELLPSLYRIRDRRGLLRALLEVLSEQGAVVEASIDELYDSWFVETCPEWVVPYIGDLVAARPIHAGVPGVFSTRSYVANTIAYRRRKGTAAVLEQLTRDVTGWPARAVEFFRLLAGNQHLNHVRPENVRTPDLRDGDALELLGGPFERAPRTAEVSRIASRRGRYNIPNVGLFVWRLQSYRVTGAQPRPAAEPDDGRYTFDPLGGDVPLFNQPLPERDIAGLAEEREVPGRLRRRPLRDELEALRSALARGEPRPATPWFQPEAPAFAVAVDGADVPPEQILICHLGDPPTPVPEGWRRPPATRDYPDGQGGQVTLPIAVGVDPALGRLAFPSGVVPGEVRVDHSYGFSADVGAGPYDRTASATAAVEGHEVGWQLGVTQQHPPEPGVLVPTLTEAVDEWNAQPPGTVGVIAVMDSSTYREDLTGAHSIVVPAGSRLLIVAAQWPVPEGPPGTAREVGRFVAAGPRPHLLGDVSVQGTDGGGPSVLLLNGLLVEGGLTVRVGDLAELSLDHCTLVPGGGGLRVNSSSDEAKQNGRLRIDLHRSICGAIELPDRVPRGLRVVDTVVDGGGGAAVDAPGAEADVRWSTVLGTAAVRSVDGGNSIFTGTLQAERRQVGCLRFSYVPPGSTTPRRYRCQPDLALKDVDPALEDAVRSRVRPAFTSVALGHPAYCQLHATCPPEVREGADDGSEMGGFGHLKQPLREANVRTVLDEYLRFGLEAGLIHVT
ncbi:MAG TPA: hypothetical protein VHL78_11145 [Actinomycetota bacterium]|nr:hypothetical protein [Actinomycetota bacterium]